MVTGGAGFIGSNYVHYLLEQHPAYQVVVVDKLTYAGNLANLADLAGDPRYTFVQADIADQAAIDAAMAGCDAVVNFAADTPRRPLAARSGRLHPHRRLRRLRAAGGGAQARRQALPADRAPTRSTATSRRGASRARETACARATPTPRRRRAAR